MTSEELMRRGRSEDPVVVAGDDPRMSEAISRHGLGRLVPSERRADDGDDVAGNAVVLAQRTRALLAKGSVPTAPLIRSILRSREGGDRLVHVTWAFLPSVSRSFLLADAGVNLAPDASTRAEIAKRVRRVARALGMSEAIAVLGHSDRAHPAVESLRRAEAWVRELADAGCAPVVGPISLDLALSDAARRAKGAEDLPEIGIVLAPDIVVGNVLYKALMLGADAVVASAVAASRFAAAVPSRASSPDEKALSVALARTAQELP
jgi:phosphate butyryltransferase